MSEWATPIQPLKPDEMIPVFHSDTSGVYEFLCGYERAYELLHGGMRKINGAPCRVEVVDTTASSLGAVHVRATCDIERGAP